MKQSGVNFIIYLVCAFAILIGLISKNYTIAALAALFGGIWMVFFKDKFKK